MFINTFSLLVAVACIILTFINFTPKIHGQSNDCVVTVNQELKTLRMTYAQACKAYHSQQDPQKKNVQHQRKIIIKHNYITTKAKRDMILNETYFQIKYN